MGLQNSTDFLAAWWEGSWHGLWAGDLTRLVTHGSWARWAGSRLGGVQACALTSGWHCGGPAGRGRLQLRGDLIGDREQEPGQGCVAPAVPGTQVGRGRCVAYLLPIGRN